MPTLTTLSCHFGPTSKAMYTAPTDFTREQTYLVSFPVLDLSMCNCACILFGIIMVLFGIFSVLFGVFSAIFGVFLVFFGPIRSFPVFIATVALSRVARSPVLPIFFESSVFSTFSSPIRLPSGNLFVPSLL